MVCLCVRHTGVGCGWTGGRERFIDLQCVVSAVVGIHLQAGCVLCAMLCYVVLCSVLQRPCCGRLRAVWEAASAVDGRSEQEVGWMDRALNQ